MFGRILEQVWGPKRFLFYYLVCGIGAGIIQVKDIAQSQFIAVKMEDSYYVFQNDEYAPPNTLGELMDVVNLSEVVELQRFSEGDNSPDSKHFASITAPLCPECTIHWVYILLISIWITTRAYPIS